MSVESYEVNFTQAAAIKAEATGGEGNDDASKAYEVVIPPSLVRARTGSRGKNDAMRKSSSVEHLEQEDAPNLDEAVEQGERVVILGSHSATSSPILPRRRPRQGGAEEDLPDPVHRGFHLGTLPRSRKPPVAPPPKTRHVYATVSKSEEAAAAAAAAKGSPPSTLPKPKRGVEGGVVNTTQETNPRPEGASANFDIPMLEVLAPLDAAVSLPYMMDCGRVDDVLMPDASASDKQYDEDAVSLQGLPSSEIRHERAEDGHIYAVVDKKSKKKKKKKPEPVEKENVDCAQGTAPFALSIGGGDEAHPKSPTRKPPVKPPRVKPLKPAPYVPRVGSPIPAILAAAAAECSSPVPPLSPRNCSPPTIPGRLPTTVEAPRSPLPQLSPLTASPFPPGIVMYKYCGIAQCWK